MSSIDWTPVASSHINAIAYDEGSNELAVEFNDGARWVYSGVPQWTYANLRDALSIGKYFNAWIKGRFNGLKMD